MTDDYLKPTLSNPFAPAPPKGLHTSTPALPDNALPAPGDALLRQQPGYYLSLVSKRHLTDLLSRKEITEDELPYLYILFRRVGELLGRNTPTISDVKIGLEFRTREKIEAVAKGTATMETRRFDVRSSGPMTRAQHRQYWQEAATELLKVL